jgi:hypothetical protein
MSRTLGRNSSLLFEGSFSILRGILKSVQDTKCAAKTVESPTASRPARWLHPAFYRKVTGTLLGVKAAMV